MALSDVELASAALLKLGAPAIASFDEDTTEADVANGLYGVTRDGLLSSHPWSFATGQATLPKLVAEPVADYAIAYQLPADLLRIISLGRADGEKGAGVIYRRQEERVHSNVDGVILTYIFRPDETLFADYFNTALIVRLAAEFCMPLTENTVRFQALTREAEIALRRARNTDAQGHTPNIIEDFSLIDVRS